MFGEFADPRMAAVYDDLGPDRADLDFYLNLAGELAVASVIEIGCGTGRSTSSATGTAARPDRRTRRTLS